MNHLFRIKNWSKLIILVGVLLLLLGCSATATPPPPPAPSPTPTAVISMPPVNAGDLGVFHYFNDSLGLKAMDEVITLFEAGHPEIKVGRNPLDHETFKAAIPVMLEGDAPPDLFSYWAGARVQSVVDAGHLQPINDLWAENGLDDAFPPAITAGSVYNGDKYFVPIGYHYVAFFYNKKLFASAGIKPPKNWDELQAAAVIFKEAGVPAFALGSRERWPAQFWFDYLLLRTAGPEYRAELMAGRHAYTDPEVVRVMTMWKEMIDAGYFWPDANAYDWQEAGDAVMRGQAAMTLMGTWITGYYKNDLGLKPEEDYDYFPFPVIDEGVPTAALGPIDGFVMAKNAPHAEASHQFLIFLAQPEPQTIWATGQGALAPNVNVDPTVYDPLMLRVQQDVAAADTFAFNYDLATTPPMAEAGLTAFSAFMGRPDNYEPILQQAEASRREIFAP